MHSIYMNHNYNIPSLVTACRLRRDRGKDRGLAASVELTLIDLTPFNLRQGLGLMPQ